MEQQVSLKEAPLMRFHKKVFLCFILGQIACGYTLSIAGTGLALATEALQLNSFWVGLLGSGTLIGLMGSLFIGNLVDRLGRKTLFMYDMIAFGLLALVQYFINDPVLLFIVRVLLGLTIAVDYTTGAALLTEWLHVNGVQKRRVVLSYSGRLALLALILQVVLLLDLVLITGNSYLCLLLFHLLSLVLSALLSVFLNQQNGWLR